MTNQLNDLKSQHIADELKKLDDKVIKNSTDILGFESRLKQKEDTLNDLEREASFFRGSYIIIKILTFFLSQDLNHLVKVVDQLVLGNQQEVIMIVTMLICFL